MDATGARKGQNPKRRTREHTTEERRKQRKEWKKRKRENRRAKSETAPTEQNCSGGEVTQNVHEITVAVSQKVTRPSPENRDFKITRNAERGRRFRRPEVKIDLRS